MNTHTLTRHQIHQLHQALFALSTEKEGKAVFKFKAKTIWNLVKNTRIISDLIQDMEQVRICLVKELAPETSRLEPGTPEHASFTNKWGEFMCGAVEVPGLLKFTQDELDLDLNDIPLGVLVALTPIVVDCPVTQ